MIKINDEKTKFASDNYSGICPEALEAIIEANRGYSRSYGDDYWTQRAADKLRDIFEIDCEVFFVFNGTAANSLSLSSLCNSYHSVLCYEYSHIETDECGGPEFFSNGTKLLLVPGNNGKFDIKELEKFITKRNDIHYPRPKVISITQATEMGTIYKIDELMAIEDIKNKYNLKIHMDGARFANAISSMNVTPASITWKVGVDVLCFGGTKNGMPVGEAVIFFKKELANEFDYRCKQAGQLASKMRFLASPWVRMLENDIWIKNAKNANEKAKILSERLKKFRELEIINEVESSAIFVKMPQRIIDRLFEKGWYFYNFIGDSSVRLMCSWATTDNDIDEFVKDIEEVIKNK